MKENIFRNLTPDELHELYQIIVQPYKTTDRFLTPDEKARRIDAKSVMNSFYGVKAAGDATTVNVIYEIARRM